MLLYIVVFYCCCFCFWLLYVSVSAGCISLWSAVFLFVACWLIVPSISLLVTWQLPVLCNGDGSLLFIPHASPWSHHCKTKGWYTVGKLERCRLCTDHKAGTRPVSFTHWFRWHRERPSAKSITFCSTSTFYPLFLTCAGSVPINKLTGSVPITKKDQFRCQTYRLCTSFVIGTEPVDTYCPIYPTGSVPVKILKSIRRN